MTGGTVVGREGTRRALCAAAALCALVAYALATGPAAGAGGDFQLEDLGNFDNPVHVENAPGEPNLLFVVEQEGLVRVVDNGEELDRSFLDISSRVECCGEQGMLSIAFHPNYATNRRFYVYYINRDPGHDIQVDQFKRRQNSAVRADRSSRREVIVVQHNQADNHNGGQLQFGPDGNLYMGTGDGGPQQDPENDAQRRSSLLGKLLRISPKGSGGYGVPAGNPFVGAGGRDEIYALGLRNPFRFSFDSSNGALTIGDVGGNDWEEVDYEASPAPGMNFGWNDFEGMHETSFGIGPNPAQHELPIYEDAHGNLDPTCAITGGVVVHDPDLPTLAGQYLFADFCEGVLRAIQVPSGAAGTDPSLSVGNPSSFGEGAGGQIYVTSLNGDVFALEPAV